MLDYTGKQERVAVLITHENSGEMKRFYFMEPSSSQVVAHRQMMHKKGVAAAALHFGKNVLCGFDMYNLRMNGNNEPEPIDGDYAFGKSGKPISSEQESEYFAEDWKDVILKVWPVAVESIGYRAFGGTRIESKEETSEEEPALPLE